MKNHGKIRHFRNYLQKVISRKNRTILGHPKLLHLVLSPNAIAKAFNVMQCIGLSAPLIQILAYFGESKLI